MKMNRHIILFCIVGMLVGCQTHDTSGTDESRTLTKPGRTWLIVGAKENGCPLSVGSLSRSCNNKDANGKPLPDEANESCQDKGAKVIWYPLGDEIEIEWGADGDPSVGNSCQWNNGQKYYHCALRPGLSSGNKYHYTVVSGDCGSDPTIIIK